jgi:hypothetical protein
MTDKTKKRINWLIIFLLILGILFFEDIKRFIYGN